MAVDWSSLHVLANTSELVQEGVLSLPPAARIRPIGLPESYWNKILMMHGQDARLVLEKRLCPTDMDSGQGRLSIPRLQIRTNFLSNEEIRTLNNRESITIPLIEPCLEVCRGLQLKKWNYNRRNFSYVLTKKWNLVAHPFERNQLREHGLIQLWSFRVNGDLCFCLVNCEAAPAAG